SGLLLDTTGACELSGRERCTCAIFAWVSWSARSILRDRSNVGVTRAEPVLAEELSVITPETWEIASSMGLMIPVSTSSGDAPGHEMPTDTVGLSTSGNWLTPMRVTARIPKRIVPDMIIQAN